jgi:ABC-type multidrug transport system fused ATPase/permease subunit
MVSLPLVLRYYIDNSLSQKHKAWYIPALAFMLMLLAAAMLEYIQGILAGRAGLRVITALKAKIFTHITGLSMRYFSQHETGSLISRVESDVQRLYMLFSQVGMQLLWAVLNVCISLAVMAWTSPGIAAWIALALIIMISCAFLIFQKMRPLFRKDREWNARISGYLSEHLPAVQLLQSLDKTEWSLLRFRKLNKERVRFASGIEIKESMVWYIMLLSPVFAHVCILYGSAGPVLQGTVTVGTVWMFIQYVQSAVGPLILLSEQISEVQKAFGAAERIILTLQEQSEITIPEQPIPVSEFQHEITFENVSFEYSPGRPVLDNISFTIKKGSSTALVGATGAGKSTITALLARWYDPTAGRILLDGIDIRSFHPREYRSLLGIVLQDTRLFPGTIAENIRGMRRDISDQAVQEAVQSVGIEFLINRLAQGYQTSVGEYGLSYGERQLLAFARAMVLKPAIILMDEATSSVDPATEMQLQQSMESLLENRTSVIIAHRLATIIHANQILVLDKGSIAESGNHQELLDKKGLYASYFQKQFINSGLPE